MSYITDNLLKKVISENEPFLTEYEFQFALAMAIKEENPDLKVKIEQKVYCDDEDKENCRCDIVAYKDNEEVLLAELKYVVTLGAQSDKTSMGARMSFVSDVKRLYDLEKFPNAEKYCIFITNKKAVYDNKVKGNNYFNDNYANIELWTPVSFKESVNDVHYLIVNAKEKGKDIPNEYKY